MDEITASQAVRVLAARLPNWTIWYGRHTGHFWALLKHRPGLQALHAEAPTAAELEGKAVEAERWLPRPALVRPVPRLPMGVAPVEDVLVARAPGGFLGDTGSTASENLGDTGPTASG
ncbi:hypothetical protein [Nonomuraea cavernae]|uniref:Uncharacterized protein n=1 Tax=Nonomuraea cavernae TaxID=2045107 RepID=A0A918DSH0_9ACTN|nr:hypothetical protein [Nonomuraea cavernae]MCA2189535.1 hypothetical protein [Nonomuraea cavernae]GGO81686.1 hypothetical protein GCM10012289_71230 [Nonomuraea cavernae]